MHHKKDEQPIQYLALPTKACHLPVIGSPNPTAEQLQFSSKKNY